ncbi:hypothetical protein CON64_17790 [Bacillus pseudomycoides]|nr:hypothetical protein CON64_17790 [Bacillus pseudomycoides]
MKSIRCFFSVWVVLQLLIFFPVHNRAETTEGSSAVKQEKDAQVKEYSVNTEVGRVTVNTTKAVVGQTVHITIDQQELNDKKKESNDQKNELSNSKLVGWLRLSNTEQQYKQDRQLSFSYDAELKKWNADYIVTQYDLEGTWQLDVLMSSDGEPIEQKIDLIQIENKEPLPDKEGSKVEELIVLNHEEDKIELKKGESLVIRVKAKDAETSVKQIVARIEGKETNFTFPLQYEKKEDSWIGKYELTETIPIDTYKLMIELVDAAGNKSVIESKYVISAVAETTKQEETDSQKEEPKEQKQQEEPLSQEAVITITEPSKQKPQDSNFDQVVEAKEKSKVSHNKETVERKQEHVEEKKEEKKSSTGVHPSDLFAIISGGFLLFFILKSNKEWGS